MRRALLRLGLALSKKDVFSPYAKFRRRQFWSLEENLKVQRAELKSLLEHAHQHVPYYRGLLQSCGVVGVSGVSLENFERLPALTKPIIRAEFERLISGDPEYQARRPYENTSGGSTGEPGVFIQDRNVWVTEMALKWLYYAFIADFPCRFMKLWGSSRDFLQGGAGLKNSVVNWLYDRAWLNTFRMDETTLAEYVRAIAAYRPKILEAYVDSMAELSKFIEAKGLEVFRPAGIVVSAGTLTAETRTLIERVWGSIVLNRYGSRETGDLACSCPQNTALHVDVFNHYLEVLDEDMRPCAPGTPGKIYVTTLNNRSMPLIRYEIGDVGIPAESHACPCGRGLPLMDQVVGRTNSMIRTARGVFDTVAISTLLYFRDESSRETFKSFSKYQLIQKTPTWVVWKVVIADEQEWVREEHIALDRFRRVLGQDVTVSVELCQSIAPLPSGKYQYVLSEVANNEA